MRRPLCFVFLFCLSVCSLYFALINPQPVDPYIRMDGENFTLTGRVTRKESRKVDNGTLVTDFFFRPDKGTGEVRVQMTSVAAVKDNETEDGPEPVLLPDGGDLVKIGETVTVSGRVKCYARATNPGEFDSYTYYLTQGVLFTLKNARVIQVSGKASAYRESLHRLRTLFGGTLGRMFPARDASVMRAMLLGDRSTLDEDLKDLYQRNGIMHILSVSGLHISILGLGLKALLDRLHVPSKAVVFICITLMYSYGVMCGMSTSAYRAVMMFVLRLTAPVLKRTYDMLSAVSLCGIMLLFEQPRYAAYSGFLMSFGAVIAIGYVMPTVKEILIWIFSMLLPGKGIWLKNKGLGAAGISVSLTMLPVYMCYYYTFPVSSLFLNPLVLPLMGLLMPAGVLSILVGLFSTGAGRLPTFFCCTVLRLYEFLCQNTSFIPGAVWYAGAPKVWQVMFFYLLLGVTVLMKKKAAKALMLIVIAVLVLSYRVPKSFQVTFLDVGQGDCSVIQTGESCYIVDGGSGSRQNVGRKVILPYLKYEATGEVDAVFVSHEDEDHISGIRELLDEMARGGVRCKQLFLADIAEQEKSPAYRELEDRARSLQIPVAYLHAGDTMEKEGVSFVCLAPDTKSASGHQAAGESIYSDEPISTASTDPNENSLVLEVTFDNMRILFTGDTLGTGMQSVKRLLQEERERIAGSDSNYETSEIRILKVAHHGSRYNTDRELLNLFPPQTAVVSCGAQNRYGHPHKETLLLLEEVNARTCITYETGAIILRNNRKNAVISTFSRHG